MADMTITILPTDTWRDSAACLGADNSLFFPPKGYATHADEAKAICATCEVTQECLEYALDTHQQLGIWGGKTIKQRQAWARKQRDVRPDWAARKWSKRSPK